MSITITVHDETASGQPQAACTLELPSETRTVRELIRNRVYQEVKDINVRAARNAGTVFHALVQPGDAERELNGYRLRQPRQIDWKTQYEVALEAFERNGFLILVDERQVGDLDEPIELKSGTQVSFVKLVPLVGG